MIRTSIILFFLLCSQFLAAQQALIDNDNGQWCIHHDGQKIMLDPAIHELENFDELGFSYFMRYEKYGLINHKGEIVLKETYSSAQQLGGGYYLFLGDKKTLLVNWDNGNFISREVGQTNRLQPSWYSVVVDTTRLIINLSSGKEWRLKREDKLLEHDFDYLLLEINGENHLYNPAGEEVDIKNGFSSFMNAYLHINGPITKRVVYRNHEINFPANAENIRVREDEILFAENGSTVLMSVHDGSVIATFPYDDVNYYNPTTLSIRKNGKMGLARKTGEILIEPIYNWVSVYDGLYYIGEPSGTGVLDVNGKQLLPCKYDNVIAYTDFFVVTNELELTGLISRKTGKTLLPCEYERFTLSDSEIRAFARSTMRIIELDSNHRFLQDLVLTNVTSLVNSQASKDESLDKRLLPLGWFYESVPQFDSLGFSLPDITRWGLKGANDTLLIPVRLSQPKFVDQADFSLLYSGRKDLELNGFKQNSYDQSQVVSHRTGKRLIPEMVISIDTMDLLSRSYVRFVSSKGPGVLQDDNSILRVDYIDGQDTRYVRYCTAKNPLITAAKASDFDAIHFPDFDLNNEPSLWVKFNINRKDHDFIRFEKAEWNFLHTNGKSVFSEPLDFAYPYSNETAIIQKDGRWGVAREDSLVIPIRFSSIKRSPISDTLFITQLKGNGKRFLDTNGRLLDQEITKFVKNSGDLSQVEVNRDKVVINSNYEVISGETRYQKLLDNNIFFSKEKKEFTIYDGLGSQLGTVKLRPEEVWFEKFVLARDRNKEGLLSVDGDTLIPFEYKKIDRLENYIFAQDGSKNLLYNENMELIRKLKRNRVLVDPASGAYTSILNDNAKVFSSKGKRIFSAKGSEFDFFHNGYLVDMDKKMTVYGSEIKKTFDFQPKSIEVMGENGYIVHDSDSKGHYFSPTWEEITLDFSIEDAKFVGEGLALSRKHGYPHLFGGDVEVQFDNIVRNVGDYSNGFLLLDLHGDQGFEFVDKNGINQFQRTFDEAKPFSGNYAPVKEKDGWTLIDKNGHYQVLPGLGEIETLSSTLFSTPMQAVYGLFDSHGNELIPAEYQQLNFLRNGIIQGRKEGEIVYFDLHGKPLALE